MPSGYWSMAAFHDIVLFVAFDVHDVSRPDTRAELDTYKHAHESPWVMLVPLIVLAVGAATLAGYGVLRVFHW